MINDIDVRSLYSPLKFSLWLKVFLLHGDESGIVIWHRIGAIIIVQNGDFLLNGK